MIAPTVYDCRDDLDELHRIEDRLQVVEGCTELIDVRMGMLEDRMDEMEEELSEANLLNSSSEQKKPEDST